MIDALRHFLLIVEHGTYREASRRAHLSQPALTASMQRLEAELGAQLLHRGRSGASATAAGEALVPRARAVLAALDDARRAVEEVEGLHAGEVRLGAGATACTYLLPPTLAAFRQAHPGIRFLLRETTSDEALDGLHDGTLDLAILSGLEPPTLSARSRRSTAALEREAKRRRRALDPGPDAQGIHRDFWRLDRLVLVSGPGVDAQTAPHVTFRRGATTRALFEAHFADAEVVMELGSIAAVKGNVRAGVGLALVSESAVVDDLARGLLVHVPDPRTPLVRELHLAHRGAARLPPAAAALRQALLTNVG